MQLKRLATAPYVYENPMYVLWSLLLLVDMTDEVRGE